MGFSQEIHSIGQTLGGDLTFTFQIALVGDNDDGKVVLVFDSQNLLVERGDFLKRIAAGNGVDAKETFTGSHVLFTHGTT